MKKIKVVKNLHIEDYYISQEGYVVFTEKYHLKRGYCCKSNCINCPYSTKNL